MHKQILLRLIIAAPLGSTLSASVPFVKLEVLDGRPVASRVFLNGQGPFRFLLDTGAQTNQVEAALARKLGLEPSFQVELDTRLGATRAPGGRVAEVTMGAAAATNQEFLFTNMEAVHALSPDIRGVLGQEFLSRFDYLLDFHGRRLIFGATVPYGARVPVRMIDGRMAIPTSYGDLVLDSGAGSLVLFHIAEPSSPGGTIRTASRASAVSMLQGVRIEIGGKSYCPALTAVAVHPGVPEDGLLPASLFGSIFVSNSAGYVILEPRLEMGTKHSPSGIMKSRFFQRGLGDAARRSLNSKTAGANALGATEAPVQLGITLRVVNSAKVRQATLFEGEKAAAYVLEKAGVGLIWQDCSGQSGPCGSALGATEFWLHVAAWKPKQALAEALGFTMVPRDPGTDKDLAGVFFPLVRVLAENYQMEEASILGAVLAHEIGHLLGLGHTPAGPMCARFGWRQFVKASSGGLLFSASQAAQMRAEIARRKTASGVNGELFPLARYGASPPFLESGYVSPPKSPRPQSKIT